jgi:[ribosomal protein S5]-alanine N-acetyltransferase
MRRLPRIQRTAGRLRLRPLEATDEAEFARVVLSSREAWAPWLPAAHDAVTMAERFRREMDRAERGMAGGTHLRLAAFLEKGELVGFFALNEVVRGVFDCAYASWQVAAGRMNEGIGTDGVRGLLAIAFDEEPDGIGLHRVQANIMPRNGPSLRVAEKIGFRREGLAQRYLRIAGVWEDHAMLALTREEWPSSD